MFIVCLLYWNFLLYLNQQRNQKVFLLRVQLISFTTLSCRHLTDDKHQNVNYNFNVFPTKWWKVLTLWHHNLFHIEQHLKLRCYTIKQHLQTFSPPQCHFYGSSVPSWLIIIIFRLTYIFQRIFSRKQTQFLFFYPEIKTVN